MSFAALLGNDALRARLSAEAKGRRLSHCYLIAGPAGSGKRTLARLLAAAAQCESANPPCGDCRACRKVLADIHPDVITVDDAEHRQLPVELIRRARAGLFIRPNEGQRKILIFPRAQDINPAAQNALLKILEEPPGYGMFLLLTDSPERLLPTIRSRCAVLHLSPLPDSLLRAELSRRRPELSREALDTALARSGGYLGPALEALDAPAPPQAAQFAAAYAARDDLALLTLFCSMEKFKRDQFMPVLESLRRLTAEALLAQNGAPTVSPEARAIAQARTGAALFSADGTLRAALADCQANVNIATICAALFALLR